MKMELIEGSETTDIRTQTPGNYPNENILHIKHGESLKSRIINIFNRKLSECLHAIWMPEGILTTFVYTDYQHFMRVTENK